MGSVADDVRGNRTSKLLRLIVIFAYGEQVAVEDEGGILVTKSLTRFMPIPLALVDLRHISVERWSGPRNITG